ncbi:major facilitator superfamily transporter [Pyrenophora tritici-repentis]|nr:major facilitator superfamily transporter [Pyrenophora tritici-repentis]
MVLTSVNVATQAIANQTVAKEDRAMAACMYGFMRSLGMPVGVALSGTVFQNAIGAALSDAGLSTDIARDSERYIFILHSMADADPRKSALLSSYSRGFHAVFVAMTVISAAALLASLSIPRSGMDTVRLAVPQRNHVERLSMLNRETGDAIDQAHRYSSPGDVAIVDLYASAYLTP